MEWHESVETMLTTFLEKYALFSAQNPSRSYPVASELSILHEKLLSYSLKFAADI